MPYLLVIVTLFAADGIVKYHVESARTEGEEMPVAGGRIILKKFHNRGAMFGMGGRDQHGIAMLSLTFSAFLTGMFAAVCARKGNRLLKTGLALLLGGAYSNTYDRLRRKYVVDHFSFHIDPERCRSRFMKKAAERCNMIVFDLSDLGIFTGAVLFVLSEIGRKGPAQEAD